MPRCAPTTTPASWHARTPSAVWCTRCATTSRSCASKRPGGPATNHERALVRRRAGEHSMSDGDLDGWEAEFVLAADRLDTPDVVEAADPSDMLRQVASAAAQVRTALRSCRETDLSVLDPDVRPRAIVVVGMGSSG